jgi:hypothetical protein
MTAATPITLIRLARSRAVKAKTVGTTPASTEAEKEPPPRATTLDEEIANLLGLARWRELACATNDTKETLPT